MNLSETNGEETKSYNCTDGCIYTLNQTDRRYRDGHIYMLALINFVLTASLTFIKQSGIFYLYLNVSL